MYNKLITYIICTNSNKTTVEKKQKKLVKNVFLIRIIWQKDKHIIDRFKFTSKM